MRDAEKEWDRKLKDSVKEAERGQAGECCVSSTSCCFLHHCLLDRIYSQL